MIRKRKINRKKKVKSYFQKIDGAITNNSVVSSNLDTIKNTVTVTIYNDNIPSKQDNGDNINTITLNDNISSKQGNGDNINTIALNDNISSKQGNGDNINIIALNDNISSKQNNGDNVNTVISSLNDNIPLKQDNGDNINTIISSIETSLNPSIPHNISQGNINDNSYHIASTSSDPIENSINRDNINDDIDQSTPPLKVSINKQIPKGYKSVEKSSESLISEIPLINQTTFSPPKPESISEYKNKFSKIKSSIENFNSELQLWTNKRYKTEKSNENSIEMNIQKSDEKENNKVSKFNENLQLWTNITENITESTRNKEIKSKILYKKYEIIKSNSIESSNNIDPTFSNNLQLWINNNNPETFNFTINEETKLKKIKNENEKRKYTSSDSYSMDEIDITFKDNLNLWVNGGT
ncbi:hypothetical protein BCR36DRAFT_586797 [Piromyces finnis]|uniref:Uncharacterized protein n=1 Tax=Piromyces finnis TaxID=1754191 RepID=A0A1Y1UXQ9_9FUNG|nr:hypothetical protein BCR36DRAFT_586797 [Piromyces finnis]|eukprot:ORX43111.1 hypothetical protein BCR36DRAFT_586797 [Piromyces finnis]